jgi:hypothetical protein
MSRDGGGRTWDDRCQEFENPPERKEPPVSEISAVEYENLGGVIVLEKELELSVVAASRQV